MIRILPTLSSSWVIEPDGTAVQTAHDGLQLHHAGTDKTDKTQECIFCGHSQAHGAELKECCFKGRTLRASGNRWRCVDETACDQRCRNNLLRQRT